MRQPLDISRVGRSVAMRAIAIDADKGLYEVHGNTEIHYVTLRPHFDCDCGDFTWRGGPITDADIRFGHDKITACAHICSCLIAEGDPEALRLMFQWIQGRHSQSSPETAQASSDAGAPRRKGPGTDPTGD
jgi:hypothetical protein